MTDWLKKTLAQLSEAIAKNLGTSIAAFLASGGYLIAIAKLTDFQTWVRQIPTDYVLTPFVLVLVALAAITRITLRQRKELRKFAEQPDDMDDEGRLVTHYGVWWKIYPDAQYMEDFPYCSCCSPPKKLVQTEWHPEEKFKCSVTSTEYQLFDGIPWPLEKARENLYSAYFKGEWLHDHFQREMRRIKTLNPEMPDRELVGSIVKAEPFNRLPIVELEPLLRRFEKPHEFIHFLQQNMHHYRKFLVPQTRKP
jgi:hypothetical protein